MFALMLALTMSADAGKLAEGVKGIAYGPQPAPAQLDGATCAVQHVLGIPWVCQSTVGAVPVLVSPGYEHGRVYAVLVSATGDTECRTLMDTLTAAYGSSRPISEYADGPLDDRGWFDGDVIATWSYNRFSKRCDFVAIHMPTKAAMDAEAAQVAAGAVGDL